MKKVWLLNHYAKPNDGRHYNIAKKLKSRGHQITIFAASTQHNTSNNRIKNKANFKMSSYDGVPFVFFRARDYTGNSLKRILNMVDYFLRTIFYSKRINLEKPDIIIASSVHPLAWLAGYILAKKYNAKFVAETRDLWPETLIDMKQIKRKSIAAKVLFKLEKFIYTKADELIFTMPGGGDYLDNQGLSQEKLKLNYINNGVDLTEHNKRKHYNYNLDVLNNNNLFKVVYTGSIGNANALEYLIECAERIKTLKYENIVFVIVGDGGKRKEFEEYVKENNIDNVIFTGNVEKKYISNILYNSNLNIITGKPIDLYRYGLSLNKLFEYFASGTPILSNIDTKYDLVQKYKAGITVEKGNAEELVKGLIYFYELDKLSYNMYCRNAYEAAKEYDFEVLADKYENIILRK